MPRSAMLRRLSLCWLLLAPLVACAAEVKVEVAPDHPTGVYAPGETVTWSIAATADGQPATGEVQWRVQNGGLAQLSAGTAPLVDGQATVSGTRADAGTLLLNVQYKVEGAPPVNALGGAVFDPDRIGPSAPPPADFDAFWAAKLAELAAVPLNVQMEPVDVGEPNIEYFKVTLDNIRGTKIYGQLARPKGQTNLPAQLQVQWAGVYPLDRNWVIWPATQGWLMFNIIAHDCPIDQPADYYKNLDATTLRGYSGQGREDRETSYFLRMYLSCYRAIDFLTKQPEWNQRTMVVQGGSQGGGQSLITAGLHPAVTALSANVAALCDHTGHLANRSPGWPRLVGWGPQPDSEKALEVSRYFDAVNFARRVKCKAALLGVGLIDTTCAPAGVIAAYNALPCPKQLVILPLAGHGGGNNAHAAFYSAHGTFMEQQRTAP
ncbi:MAG: acetylxylan esterase [Fimbriimonadaceae bacterium]|nr:acetylxylan esterase [Fimbriimonadaceae bacterium]